MLLSQSDEARSLVFGARSGGDAQHRAPDRTDGVVYFGVAARRISGNAGYLGAGPFDQRAGLLVSQVAGQPFVFKNAFGSALLSFVGHDVSRLPGWQVDKLAGSNP